MAEDENSNLCDDSGTVFAFLDGVLTTPAEASRVSEEFIRIHGSTSPGGDQIRYEILYNNTNGFDDFVETFDQRLKEQEDILGGRFELFFEAVQGGGPWWDDLIAEASSAGNLLKSGEYLARLAD